MRRWSRHLVELQPATPERRVRRPEAARPAEVGQSGVDTHSCTGRYNQSVGVFDQIRSVMDGSVVHFGDASDNQGELTTGEEEPAPASS